jgi:hypothetical protein
MRYLCGVGLRLAISTSLGSLAEKAPVSHAVVPCNASSTNEDLLMAKGLVKGEANILLTKHLEELGFEWLPEFVFHSDRQWRFDYLIWNEQGRFALEIEGGAWTRGRHTRGKGFIADMEKYNFAAIMGYRVLRFTPDQILKGVVLEFLRKHCT